MSHRLFVALRPPAEVRAQLLGLMGGVPDARWQTDAQLHATLAFVGEVHRHQADAVAVALSRLESSPLTLGFGAFDTFLNSSGQVSTLWIGLTPHAGVAALANRVSQRLLVAGIPLPSRKFVPHITLARFPARGVPPASLVRFLADRRPPAVAFAVESVTLFESHLARGGAHYEAVLEIPLRARA